MNTNKRYILSLLRVFVVLLFMSAFMSRCASIMQPSGGPIDTLPPVIVNLTPANFMTNMKDKNIFIEFNEFVQLKDQNKEFFTSPQMKKKPVITLRGRGVAIQIKDTLLENTTYALNFGSTIRDNNEGNPLHSMRYVFSTGPTIDSMVCSGYTSDSYKADSVSKSFIYFFNADSIEHVAEYDSTMFKYKPTVIGRAETNGIFIAQNLKPIKYRIYAFQDENGNQTYEPSVDKIGFLRKEHNPAELPNFGIWYDSIRHYVTAEPQLYFRMFTDVTFKRQILQDHQRPSQHKAMLYFGTAFPTIDSLRFNGIPSDSIIIEPITKGRDTLAVWFNIDSKMLPDTIKGSITYHKHDSLNILRPTTEELKLTWRFIESKEKAKEREKQERAKKKAEESGEEWVEPKVENPFKHNLPASGDINPEEHLTIEFDQPIIRFDTLKVLLTNTLEDNNIKDVPVHFIQDTANMRKWYIHAPWKNPGSSYTLTIPSGAAEDVAGLKNDSIIGKYTLLDPEKFATVKLTIVAKSDTSKYIVQLLDDGGRILQEKIDVTGGLVQFNYVKAGDIKFRVIEDNNGNGKWDSGNLVKHIEPERTELYQDAEGKDSFVTKVNWEFELTINMNELFAPVTMESLIKLLDNREAQRITKELKEHSDNPKSKNDDDSRMNNNMNSTGGMFNSGGAGGNSMPTTMR